MVIPDSNIFIDFWKNPTDDVRRIFDREEIILCGAVRAELLQGAVSVKNFHVISETLDAFREVNLENGDWDRLGEILFILRTKGIHLPLADAIIATVAIKYGIPVWTNDRHFSMIKNAINDIEIWSET